MKGLLPFKNKSVTKIVPKALIIALLFGGIGAFMLKPSNADTVTLCGTVKTGSSGNCVKYVQRMLNSTNYMYDGVRFSYAYNNDGLLAVDGSFGPKTFAAVKAFQKSAPPLVQDGSVGPATWDRLCYRVKTQKGNSTYYRNADGYAAGISAGCQGTGWPKPSTSPAPPATPVVPPTPTPTPPPATPVVPPTPTPTPPPATPVVPPEDPEGYEPGDSELSYEEFSDEEDENYSEDENWNTTEDSYLVNEDGDASELMDVINSDDEFGDSEVDTLNNSSLIQNVVVKPTMNSMTVEWNSTEELISPVVFLGTEIVDSKISGNPAVNNSETYSATLKNLKPAGQYKFTIKSKTSSEDVTYVAKFATRGYPVQLTLVSGTTKLKNQDYSIAKKERTTNKNADSRIEIGAGSHDVSTVYKSKTYTNKLAVAALPISEKGTAAPQYITLDISKVGSSGFGLLVLPLMLLLIGVPIILLIIRRKRQMVRDGTSGYDYDNYWDNQPKATEIMPIENQYHSDANTVSPSPPLVPASSTISTSKDQAVVDVSKSTEPIVGTGTLATGMHLPRPTPNTTLDETYEDMFEEAKRKHRFE